MRRLIFSILLLTALVGHTADDIFVDGVVYEYYYNQYTLVEGYLVKGLADDAPPMYNLHIPSFVTDDSGDSYTVLGVKTGAFEDNLDIEYVKIDEGVTYIGEDAFYGCDNLRIVILPEGLETIEVGAFAFCTGLTTMVIPSTVTDIQSLAFMHCTGVTDVYFLMEATQLSSFVWWDGTLQQGGGEEFNTPEHTMIHVPDGLLEDYVASGKFDAWLPQLHEDDGAYPLWWIVNHGVVGREYTVSDDLQGVYVDKNGNLYAKDDNHWMIIDEVQPGECDYMSQTGLMDYRQNHYDQSNWVILHGSDAKPLSGLLNHVITQKTLTGTLCDKLNPTIEVSDECEPTVGDTATYVPNTYIPASFMGRTQLADNNNIYAFVQPKPNEYCHVRWASYRGEVNGQHVFDMQERLETVPAGLDGAFAAIAEENATMSLIENEVYDLVGIIKGKNLSDEPTFDEGHLSDKLMLKLVKCTIEGSLLGDINVDGEVDVTDVNICVNIILSKANQEDYEGNADVTGDGIVDVSDVNLIVNIVLGKYHGS